MAAWGTAHLLSEVSTTTSAHPEAPGGRGRRARRLPLAAALLVVVILAGGQLLATSPWSVDIAAWLVLALTFTAGGSRRLPRAGEPLRLGAAGHRRHERRHSRDAGSGPPPLSRGCARGSRSCRSACCPWRCCCSRRAGCRRTAGERRSSRRSPAPPRRRSSSRWRARSSPIRSACSAPPEARRRRAARRVPGTAWCARRLALGSASRRCSPGCGARRTSSAASAVPLPRRDRAAGRAGARPRRRARGGITGAAALPIAAGVAILWHRLYDLDLFMNRSLVYAGLSLVLLAAFGAIVTLGNLVGERLCPTEGGRSSPSHSRRWRSIQCGGGCGARSIACFTATATTPTRSSPHSGATWAPPATRRRCSPTSPRPSHAASRCRMSPSRCARGRGTCRVRVGALPRRPDRASAHVPRRGHRPPARLPRTVNGRLSETDRRLLADLAHPVALAVNAVELSAGCSRRASSSSPRARRSAGACDATCTTAWARPSPGWSCSSTPRRTSCAAIRPPSSPCWPGFARPRRRPSPTSAGSCTSCARRRWTSWGSRGDPRVRRALPRRRRERPAARGRRSVAAAAAARRGRGRHTADRAGGARQRRATCQGAELRRATGATGNGHDRAASSLVIEIRDDGRGLPDDLRPGVGLGSMRERAAEVGGTCTITRGRRRRARPCRPSAAGVMSDEPIRLLIADDHPAFRAGLRLLLESLPDLDVTIVAEAEDGEQALAAAIELTPDVIVMDLQMPGLGGIETTRRVVEAAPHVRVLVLTMFEDENSVFAALRAGAHGYVLKGAGQDQLARAIRAVAEGESIFSPAIAQRVLSLSRWAAQGTARSSSRSSRTASARCSTSSRAACRTPTSRASSCSARRPCATTSRTSSPSCRRATAPRRSYALGRPASGWIRRGLSRYSPTR